MTAAPTLQVRLRAITWEAEGILGFEFVPAKPGERLPPFEAGAHLDVHLGGGLQRSYSLLNPGDDRPRYCIAVQRDPASRGGSRAMHEALRVGQTVTLSAPRNNFALDEAAAQPGAPAVLIAGGIGITPILAMLRRLSALRKPWQLHYAARTRAQAAFVDEIQALAAATQQTAQIVFDREPGARMLDLAAIVQAVPPASHLYCCGPLPMLEAFDRASAALPRARVHVEYFSAKEAPATAGGFSLKLAKSGRTLQVPAGKTILDTLIDAGIEPPYSCREGICGTCETAVLEGEPEHRDLVLSDAEKAENRRMMICCSGARSASLTLDL